MSESYVEVREDGSVRLAGTLAYPEATVADVLTVQADGSIAAAAGGGSSSFVATGPYPIAFDTPGLVNPVGSGIVLDTFAVGTLFLQVLVIASTPFGGGGADDIYAVLEIGPAGDWDNQAYNVWSHVDLLTVSTSPAVAQMLTGGSVPPFKYGGGGIGIAGYNSFGVYVSANGSGLDAGAADIYVVTATPTAP